MAIDPESTDPNAPDDALLRRYVLGQTSADESERIDELSVSSAEVATRLQAVEYDLIDAYAAGQLSREALTALRSSYVSQADWQAEVGFSDTLRAWHARAAASGAAPEGKLSGRRPSDAGSPERSSAAWFRRREAQAGAASGLVPRWWLGAAAAIALLAIGGLAFMNLSLRRDIENLRAERASLDSHAQRLQAAEQRLEAQLQANAEAAKELERLRMLPSSSSSGAGSAVPMVIASFLLPSSVRGANDITPIALPPKVDAVQLQLPLETTRFATIDADVRDAATSQIVWRGTGIRPIGRAVALNIPANTLKSRTYLLELRGLRPGATPEPLAPAAFRVVLP
jgi:hypothetical protein